MSDEDFDLFGDDNNEEVEKMMPEKKAAADAAKAKEKKAKPVLKSSVVLDIKPLEQETDLDALVKFVKDIEMEGLEWKAHDLVPMAFGIKKITIMCHAVDDLVSIDDLVDKIEDNEDVGSVEVVSFSKL